jgi:peptide/nickel transport system permease protein
MTAVSTSPSILASSRLAPSTSRRREVWTRLKRSGSAKVGASILLVLALAAIFAPILARVDPIQIGSSVLTPPNSTYWFGTDAYGRDIFSRVLYGARLSLLIGLISVSIASALGVTIGLLSGYYGRWVDTGLMRMIDVMLAFPGILLALVIVSMLGPSLVNLMIAVGISSIPAYARLTRSLVLAAREELYVEAAQSIGTPDGLILVRHLLPNIFAPILVTMTLGIGGAILSAAALSFIGLGAQPPTPEWGRMLSEGRQYLRDQWWIATFPGLAIMLTVLGMNLLGDGLRDALDPRLKM